MSGRVNISTKPRQAVTAALAAFLVVVLLGGEAQGAGRLLNYENRVVRAAEQVERIKTDRDYGEEGIEYIKGLLPRSEHVEFDGQDVAVDNTWLHVLLDSYAAQQDPQQQAAKLNEAAGRLRALDEHLRRASSASSDSADAKGRIREILSRRAYQPEPDTLVGAFAKRVLRKARELVGRVLSALQSLVEKVLGAGARSGWVSRILLLGLLAVAVFFLVQLVYRVRMPRTRRKKTRVILGEEIAADNTPRELAEIALAAARAGDFRTAVRKLYVSLLYELAERNLIELEDSATNHEYLRRASRFSVLEAPMNYLTDRFDHVWYGMFPSSEEDFASYQSRYEEAMLKARSLAEQAASAVR